MKTKAFWIDYYKEDGDIFPINHDTMMGNDVNYHKAVAKAIDRLTLDRFAKAEIKFKFIDWDSDECQPYSTLFVIKAGEIAEKGGAK